MKAKDMTFGKLLRHARKEAGCTMRGLAEHLRISVSYVSDIERGSRAPFSVEKIRTAARFLEFPVAPLIRAVAVTRGYAELDLDKEGVALRLAGAWASHPDRKRLAQRISALLESEGL